MDRDTLVQLVNFALAAAVTVIVVKVGLLPAVSITLFGYVVWRLIQTFNK